MTRQIRDLLLEAADWVRRNPALHSDDLDVKLARLGYQLARVRRGTGRWVLLRNLQPVAHAVEEDDSAAIRRLANGVHQ